MHVHCAPFPLRALHTAQVQPKYKEQLQAPSCAQHGIRNLFGVRCSTLGEHQHTTSGTTTAATTTDELYSGASTKSWKFHCESFFAACSAAQSSGVAVFENS